MDFSAIKAGDRVWVGTNGGTRTQGIKTVAIVTPTLIRIREIAELLKGLK